MAVTPSSWPIERLADALQDCLNEAAEWTVARLDPRLDRQDMTLSKQNAAHRLLSWKAPR